MSRTVYKIAGVAAAAVGVVLVRRNTPGIARRLARVGEALRLPLIALGEELQDVFAEARAGIDAIKGSSTAQPGNPVHHIGHRVWERMRRAGNRELSGAAIEDHQKEHARALEAQLQQFVGAEGRGYS